MFLMDCAKLTWLPDVSRTGDIIPCHELCDEEAFTHLRSYAFVSVVSVFRVDFNI